MSLPFTLPTLTVAETDEIRVHLESVKSLLAPKFINLQPEDRKRYGSIGEQNKLVVTKVKDYHDSQPDLASPKVNWGNYNADFTTRSNYEKITALLGEIQELCDDPRTLVDYTLYGMALQDYRYTKFSAEDGGGGTAGYEAKYDDLKQFFEKEPAPAP